MKGGEINVVSMVVAPQEYMVIGWTDSSALTVKVLRLNFHQEFRDLARKMGVVSAFRVQAACQLSSEALTHKIDTQMDSLEAASKKRRRGK